MMKEQTRGNTILQYISRFMGFKNPNNIDVFFNRKFQQWLFSNSHQKAINPNDNDGFPMLEFNSEGFITNATFSKKTADGLPLTKKDFAKVELKLLLSIEAKQLGTDENKRIDFYKDYLEKIISKKKELIHKESIKLIDLFNSTDKYYEVMDALIAKELINDQNYWVSSMGGDKKLLSSILKYLSRFFKEEHSNITNEDRVRICHNTFNLPLGLDTMKRATPRTIPPNIKATLDKIE